ncbi:MAG: peptide chain release factor 3 [Planctomyces sp.]|nr:peptide chain release factor 3 [Planctomyces sp.]
MSEADPIVAREAARRRTFAIISHPDAGKTTLTEKLLLYGGCIEVAGAVRGRKTQKSATSDWMALEKQRGISVSSTVLTFEFEGCQVNLLDTPGHHDFSEDTYRTLVAADCAVMVIDLANGVESQTEKLFNVCKIRKIPVLTFVNKVDRPGKETLDVLEDIETKLGIIPVPVNWPLGTGFEFRGVINLESRIADVFEDRDNLHRLGYRTVPLAEIPEDSMPQGIVAQAKEEVELVQMAGATYDRQRFLNGEVSPVFFGSALTNYGVEQFLRGFLKLCPPPRDRDSDVGRILSTRPEFSGFVFKIQANLDPKHRDRIAFVRVCSGRFRREMEVFHPRTGKKIRLRRAHKLFGQERETMDEAFPGDIIGLVNPGEFHLGDTICEGSPVNFESLPQFSPEFFATMTCTDTSRRKQFERGLSQLMEEGAIQLFNQPHSATKQNIMAAVGELQFDVVKFRLQSEYDTETEVRWLNYKVARWVVPKPGCKSELNLLSSSRLVHDQYDQPAILFLSDWEAQHCERQNPEWEFLTMRFRSNAS